MIFIFLNCHLLLFSKNQVNQKAAILTITKNGLWTETQNYKIKSALFFATHSWKMWTDNKDTHTLVQLSKIQVCNLPIYGLSWLSLITREREQRAINLILKFKSCIDGTDLPLSLLSLSLHWPSERSKWEVRTN